MSKSSKLAIFGLLTLLYIIFRINSLFISLVRSIQCWTRIHVFSLLLVNRDLICISTSSLHRMFHSLVLRWSLGPFRDSYRNVYFSKITIRRRIIYRQNIKELLIRFIIPHRQFLINVIFNVSRGFHPFQFVFVSLCVYYFPFRIRHVRFNREATWATFLFTSISHLHH